MCALYPLETRYLPQPYPSLLGHFWPVLQAAVLLAARRCLVFLGYSEDVFVMRSFYFSFPFPVSSGVHVLAANVVCKFMKVGA